MTESAPEDDSTVGDSLVLYRWVSPVHIRSTEWGPELREEAFKNFPHPEHKRMSIVLDDRLRELRRVPASIVGGRAGYGLVALTAGEVRTEEQRVLRSPMPDEAAHGDVWGDKPVARRRRLAEQARWIVRPGT